MQALSKDQNQFERKTFQIISASLAAFFFIFANVFLSISSEAEISRKFLWKILSHNSSLRSHQYKYFPFDWRFCFDFMAHQLLVVRDSGYEVGQFVVVHHPRANLMFSVVQSSCANKPLNKNGAFLNCSFSFSAPKRNALLSKWEYFWRNRPSLLKNTGTVEKQYGSFQYKFSKF